MPSPEHSAREAAEGPGRPTIRATVHRCPTCNQHFSGDAQFCPFDGDPLVAAPGYRADADPLLGKVIEGRYEVESVLGEGGMGTVYRVRHRALEKRFALKVMRADLAEQGELAARFIQEARAAAAIVHPNIVQITDFGKLPNGAPYFVMELLDGMPLSKLLRTGGPLPAAQTVRFLKQAASALLSAHAAGVVHRDLKPDNVHLTASDVVKILDFGVAKVAGAGRLTKAGMVFGTPHYMSPEQASGGQVDHRTDIYALGIIMYEMFTGRVPFEADSYMGVLTKHMFMAPEPFAQTNAATRELGALEDVVMKCLEKKPEARYPSMQELIADVESIVEVSDERLHVLRPSRGYPKRVMPLALADELEPPAREEVAARRPAGLARQSPWGIAVACALGAAVVLSGAFVFRRVAERPRRPATLVSPAVVPMQRPSAVIGAATTDPAAASVEPGAGPVPSIQPSASAEPREAPAVSALPSNGPKHKPAVNGSPRPSATTSLPFGGGDIVNPWAK